MWSPWNLSAAPPSWGLWGYMIPCLSSNVRPTGRPSSWLQINRPWPEVTATISQAGSWLDVGEEATTIGYRHKAGDTEGCIDMCAVRKTILTHCGQVMLYGNIDVDQHWFT